MATTGFRFPLLAFTILVLPSCWKPFTVDGQEILQLGISLTGNQTLKSKNGTFELGFFNPNGSNNWYIGIWYGQISEKTIIWLANRDNPIRNMAGVLNLSTDGNLKLYDLQGRSVWSTDNSLKASRAIMLDSGNFVMIGAHNTSVIVWESFLHPTDTWLPGVKQWNGLQLISWKSSEDPATGLFSFQIDPSPGKEQILLAYNQSVQYWYSGDWVGDHFTYTPELGGQKMVVMSFVKLSPSSKYVIFEMGPQVKFLARFVMYMTGELRMFWYENGEWNLVASLPRDQCDVHNLCGTYAACNSNNVQFCTCLWGFIPKHKHDWDSQDWWSSGCVREIPLQCSATNGSTDGFLEVINKSVPLAQAVHYTIEVTQKECEAACLNNCSCTAFSLGNSAFPSCQLWFADLLNVRDSPQAQAETIFIRLAASQLSHPSSSSKSKAHFLRILLPGITVFPVLLALVFLVWRLRRPNLLKDDAPSLLRTFTYRELQVATENFKHLLGSGAFGTVYKGSLPDNTLIAVKKLDVPEHVEKQFRAEISTMGNIHHVNLLRLRGFCADKSRRLLVYEYMPNGSLEEHLFHAECKMLDWKTRFQIALGTARGLVYLHEECKDRIIHCDIKPANILLDGELCPKVADFGMAKVVGRDFSRVLTTARGTLGYLAPEWLYGLPITPKADVFSFGMTLLEIISGRRNREVNAESSRLFFATWAATQLNKGNSVGVVDGRIANNADVEQVKKAAAVAKLCVEEDEDIRPSMAQVLQMLEGTMELPATTVPECSSNTK